MVVGGRAVIYNPRNNWTLTSNSKVQENNLGPIDNLICMEMRDTLVVILCESS